ncbi:amidohydrolase family protein [Aspergillus bombycis]|uniref:Amidohydrolase family protein n=1 Tax=Aspergillus bombycis TaxID=109264 RepID=A0A1F7ZMK2_9EURO|nr:amidohydrolase family protein [Aspergillus bombycis]OGM40687.1 amidohydrolase family protein [Aspergillus bombycis]
MKTLYKNAHFITPQSPNPTCMVTENDRIIYLGEESTAATLHPDSEIHDLEGRKVLPGFIDGPLQNQPRELHFPLRHPQYHQSRRRRQPDGARLFCRGWMHSMTNGEAWPPCSTTSTRAPSSLTPRTCTPPGATPPPSASSTSPTPPDPAGGVIHRDAAGNPTGLLSEAAAVNIVWPHVAKVASLDEKLNFIRAGIREYTRAGYTGVVEMATDENLWSTVLALREREEVNIRLAAHWIISPKDDEEEVLRQVDRAIELHSLYNAATSPDLRIAGIKVICDGVVDACTAALTEPYASNGDNCAPLWDAEMLKKVVRKADRAGLQCALHAIGDATDAKRLADLGITASVQPVHADPAILRAWPRLLGPDRCGRAFAYRDFLDHGAHLAIGTDSPTAPHLPLRNLYTATTRRSAREPESLETVNEHFSLGLLEAITAATGGSAYSCFADGFAGTLEVGKKADFVVVDMAWEAERLLEAEVWETWFDGRRVWRRE